MGKIETIIFGVDTPDNYSPEYVFQTLGIQPMPEAHERCDRSYRVLFLPSFHPESCVTVQARSDFSQISLVTMQTNLWYYGCYLRTKASGKWPPEETPPFEPDRWEETREVDHSLIADFLSQMDALQPESIPDLEVMTIDGMEVHSEYCDASGQRNSFSTVSAPNDSRQFQYIYAIYELASDTLREEKSIRILEDIHSYLGLGLPVKDLGGDPYRVRIFGRLSSSYQKELSHFFDKLPKTTSLLMDLSNFEGMGTLLYPVFQRLVRRRRSAPIAWWASSEARRHLEALGVSPSTIFDTREDALTKSRR